jgi:hypothetical protein
MSALSTASPAVRSSLEWASRFGWKVFPVTAGDKKPAVKGWQALASDDPAVWAGWWSAGGSHPDCLVGVATGPASGIWVLDVDPKSGGKESWIALGEEHQKDWGSPLVARTPSGGRHQIYAYPSADALANLGADRVKNRTSVKAGIDVRGAGGLVVCPGAEDRPIVSNVEALADAPAWLLELVLKVDGDVDAGGGTAGTSKLADLLDHPPTGEGGRNDWLTKVAGHFAAETSREDRYRSKVRLANRSLTPPLGPAEVEKVSTSIWTTEVRKVAAGKSSSGSSPDSPDDLDRFNETVAAALGQDSGGLRSARRDGKRIGRLEVEVVRKEGDKPERVWYEWADFDVVADGVTELGTERHYRVTLIVGRTGEEIRDLLPVSVLADRRKLDAWLMERKCTIGDPKGTVLNLSVIVRLARYIEAQDPPVFRLVDHLGYSDEAGEFVTADGVITAEGPRPFGAFMPHPRLARSRTTFRYGHGRPEAEARAVLREILTFHHDHEASVFGAWWAATFLKHVVMRESSLFPFMAIEAPSESGKTAGMFGMLIRMSGSGKQGTLTAASFRDAASVNRSGIIWVDDPNSIENLKEALRNATAEGWQTKKGENLEVNQGVQLVAPIVLTAEHLGLREQKADEDRAVHLEARTPTDRMSLKPGRGHLPQWHDMVEFKARHPDLSIYAGTLVQLALRHERQFAEDLNKLRGAAGRRLGDKIAVLQAGALLLDELTGGQDGHYDVVGHWIDESGIRDTGAENTLTLKVLPVLLNHVGHVDVPTRDDRRDGLPQPVLVRHGPDGPEVWVNARLCAQWWQRVNRGRHVEERTETATAFAQQLRALGATTERAVRIPVPGARLRDAEEKLRYRLLPQAVAERLLSDT